jgi:hypothetical protein
MSLEGMRCLVVSDDIGHYDLGRHSQTGKVVTQVSLCPHYTGSSGSNVYKTYIEGEELKWYFHEHHLRPLDQELKIEDFI